MSLFDELKRRNVHRMAGLYLVGAWLLVQVAATIFPVFGFGDTAVRATVVVLAIGLVPALAFAWVFEITPEGLRRESEIDRSESITPHTGKTMDRLIVAVLVLALVYFAVDKFVLDPARDVAVQQQTEAKVAEAHQAGRTEALVESYGEKSIAVLPFTDMSSAQDQGYMGDGLAEELLNLLARIPELRVISRSSAFSFKGQKIEIPEIAKRLNVAHVLEGSVRKSGNTIRITAQLIDARADTHLWSETWDRPLDDIFAVQDEIAAVVVTQLKITLLGGAPKARATDPDAYVLYLQARMLARRGTVEACTQSEALLRQAVAVDAHYAPYWDALSRLFGNQASVGMLTSEEGFARAREMAQKAIQIDSDYAPAHANLGWIVMYGDNDFAAAARHFQRALAINPADADVIGDASYLLRNLGRLDEALALQGALLRRDPLNVFSIYNLGFSQLWAGRFDAAIASFRTVLRLSPGRGGSHYGLTLALLAKGDADGALAEIEQESIEVWRAFGLPLAYHALGRKTDVDTSLAALLAKYDEREWAYYVAGIYAFRGEADQAFAWLDKAVGYRTISPEITVDSLFDNLRGDPRWLPFLRKLGKAPEQLAAINFDVKLPQQ